MVQIDREDFKEWLILKGLSPRSVKEYLRYFDNCPYHKLEYEDIIMFLKVKDNNVAKAFLKNLFSYIRTKKDISPEEKTRAFEIELSIPKLTGRKRKRLPKYLTFDEVKILCSVMSDRLKCMTLLMYMAGLRPKEVVAIKPYDFNWSVWEKEPTKMGKLRVIGKGNKELMKSVAPELMYMIGDYIKEINKKQSAEQRLFKWGYNWFWDAVRKAGKEALGKEVYPYMLRHGLATRLMETGTPLNYIQAIMGHADISTTTIYTHLDNKKIDDKHLEAFQNNSFNPS